MFVARIEWSPSGFDDPSHRTRSVSVSNSYVELEKNSPIIRVTERHVADSTFVQRSWNDRQTNKYHVRHDIFFCVTAEHLIQWRRFTHVNPESLLTHSRLTHLWIPADLQDPIEVCIQPPNLYRPSFLLEKIFVSRANLMKTAEVGGNNCQIRQKYDDMMMYNLGKWDRGLSNRFYAREQRLTSTLRFQTTCLRRGVHACGCIGVIACSASMTNDTWTWARRLRGSARRQKSNR